MDFMQWRRAARAANANTPRLLLLVGLLIGASLVQTIRCHQELKLDPAEVPQVTEPKLVCYYTSWAKDRPAPWNYVSTMLEIMVSV